RQRLKYVRGDSLPIELDMTKRRRPHPEKVPSLACDAVSDAHAITRLRVLDARLHDANILLIRRQAVSHGVRRCVDLAAGADLAVDVRDVPRHGAQAEHKLAGYFEIRTAGGDQAQDLDFPMCKVVRISEHRPTGRFANAG